MNDWVRCDVLILDIERVFRYFYSVCVCMCLLVVFMSKFKCLKVSFFGVCYLRNK